MQVIRKKVFCVYSKYRKSAEGLKIKNSQENLQKMKGPLEGIPSAKVIKKVYSIKMTPGKSSIYRGPVGGISYIKILGRP